MGIMTESKYKPRIGVTLPDEGYRMLKYFSQLGVKLAGGEPVALTASEPHYGEKLDGLLLAGGRDIYPPRYDQPAKREYTYDHNRDAMEEHWFHDATEQNIPVLGICRGAQFINILRGGSLHRDFSKVYEKAEYPNGTIARIFYRKLMFVKQESRIFSILHCTKCAVNSMHTQSIDALGEGLEVSGQEANGIVQCIEDKNHPWMLGVQFHPEFMLHVRKYRRLFRQLVEQADLQRA